MSISFDEKRNFIRMKMDSPISYTTQGSQDVYEGHCLNLSAVGMLFTSDRDVPRGTLMEINITPPRAVVQPLNATVEVIRSQTQNNGSYMIAVQIKAMH